MMAIAEILASDISAETPIDLPDGTLQSYDIDEFEVEDRSEEQAELVRSFLDQAELALALTRRANLVQQVGDPEEVLPETNNKLFLTYVTPGVNGHSSLDVDQVSRDDFINLYEDAIKQPRTKFEFDKQIVFDLFAAMGPTNPLLSKEKGHEYDIGFEIGRLIRLLSNDYNALPEDLRRPEERDAEAMLREELALLWTPTGLGRGRTIGNSAFLFNLEDPNIFTPNEIINLSESERWKIIGQRLADESAYLYREIYASPTASEKERLEALCRCVDMKTRSLRIERTRKPNRFKDNMSLVDEMNELNDELVEELKEVPAKRAKGANITRGFMTEITRVAQLRAKALEVGDYDSLIRLATKREDEVHVKVPRLYSRRNATWVNLSHDIVVEHFDGRSNSIYQVKAMTPAAYRAMQEREPGSPRVYAAEMLFEDPDELDDPPKLRAS